jgi:NitT/TauT family transport system permease protein
MRSDKLARSAVSLASLLAGLAIWEIAGRHTSSAFLVPFSETVARLSDVVADWSTWAQFLDSAILFLTGFTLALVVGMPAGLLFSRVRAVRVGIEPYIMILYATPMVALIPFILSLMGFGFVPKVLFFLPCSRFSTTPSKVRAASSPSSSKLRARSARANGRFGWR